jgi:membrane protein DedA with SNARE-associated domain
MRDLMPTLQLYLAQYGYGAIFISILLEDFGLPVPGETLLIAGSLLAAGGSLDITVLLITAWIAAVIGDNIGYAIGRYGGRRLVLRYGHHVLITRERLNHAEKFFQRHSGEAVVTLARFVAILRQLNGIIAGISEMRWYRFLLFNAVGAALWVCFWGFLTYELGSRVVFYRENLYTLIFILVIMLVATSAILFFFRMRTR